jgi:hypothetical protein
MWWGTCDGVTLAGDASHPLTPNIGQGACCTLEDAMFFGKSFLQHWTWMQKWRQKHQPWTLLMKREISNKGLTLPFLNFKEWHPETHPLAVEAYKVGMLVQSRWSVICFLWNWLLIANINCKTILQHTMFGVGKLPTIDSKPI